MLNINRVHHVTKRWYQTSAVMHHGIDNREDRDSRTWGIFIRGTAYFIVIQSSMTLCFVESQWNMSYSVWKCLTYGSPHPIRWCFCLPFYQQQFHNVQHVLPCIPLSPIYYTQCKDYWIIGHQNAVKSRPKLQNISCFAIDNRIFKRA